MTSNNVSGGVEVLIPVNTVEVATLCCCAKAVALKAVMNKSSIKTMNLEAVGLMILPFYEQVPKTTGQASTRLGVCKMNFE